MATTEKVAKIGLSEFKYAKLNEEETVESMDDIKNIPGLQEAKQTVVMDSEIIFADDGPYLILNSGITELKLEVGIVDIPTEHKPDLLGVLIEQGMEIYKKRSYTAICSCIIQI
ncbi:major tail protein [Listeria cornellensis]|uniref:Phage major tail protein n=1 Tax=Listeria cornellensis FSL F6-0969 TaxID=1265820 RepID=W7CA84_9LIST|nr:major tail protein [Listeria cornellensis]EUJ29608.1 phage major tail protein [Listeria cornellensis FSL F6-0969]